MILDRFLAEVIESGVSFPYKIDFSSEECLLKNELYVHKDEEARNAPSLEDKDQIDSFQVNKQALVANLEARYNCFISKQDFKIMLGAYNLDIQETKDDDCNDQITTKEDIFNGLPNMLNWRLLLEKEGLNKDGDTDLADFNVIRDLQVFDSSSMLAKRCERITAGFCQSEDYKNSIRQKVTDVIEIIKKFQLKVINE
jgi:hypothetical protein